MHYKNAFKKNTMVFVCETIVVFIFLIYMSYVSFPFNQETDTLKSLRLADGYTITNENAGALSSAVIDGSFAREVQKNEQILIFADRVRITIKQNGNIIFRCGQQGSYPSVAKMGGTQWYSLVSPGVSPDDNIEIKIENVYANNSGVNTGIFLSNLYVGDKYALLVHNCRLRMPQIIIGFAIFAMGLVYTISIGFLRLMGIRITNGYLACGLLLMSGALCSFIDYSYITLMFNAAYMINLLDYLLQMLICEFLLIYFKTFIQSQKMNRILSVAIYVWAVMIIAYCLLKIHGKVDVLDLAGVFLPVGFVVIIGTFAFLVVERKKHSEIWKNRIVTSGLILCAMTGVEVVHFFVTGTYWIWVFQIGLLIFTVSQYLVLVDVAHMNIEKAKRTELVERELEQNRILMMMSQIQPHFMYNSLTAIARLCDTDPQKAKLATMKFTEYLRGNIDSLSEAEPIPFSKELEHIKAYLALEQMRFGDDLKVTYDIATEDFRIPALTVQPLVENAVKYGVGKKEDGGTVTIATREFEGYYEVIVSDDGVGFIPGEKKDDGRKHIGMDNAKKRLIAQCGGEIIFESVLGVGTTATIKMPKDMVRFRKSEELRENTDDANKGGIFGNEDVSKGGTT